MAPPRFVPVPDAASPDDGAPVRDPNAWRRQVAVDLEQLTAKPRAAQDPQAQPADFPELPRTIIAHAKPSRRKRGAGTFALASIAAVVGLGIGFSLPRDLVPSLASLPSFPSLAFLTSPKAKAPVALLAVATAAPVRPAPVNPVPLVEKPPEIRSAPIPTPEPLPPLPTVAAAAPQPRAVAPQVRDRPAPTAVAQAATFGPLEDEIMGADLTLAAAYGQALRSGVPPSLLRASRNEWRMVREAAAERSPQALLEAYDARIDEVRAMADEAMSANRGGFAEVEGAPVGRR